MSTVIQSAVAWARGIAADASHGYDQANRWGPDYDCSSFVISAYKAAGVPLACTYTGDMRGDMLRCGFAVVSSAAVDLATGAGLEAGDVLLNYAHHTALYLGGGRIVQASINERGGVTGGAPGDQTGREICERAYYNYPWDCVLRYGGSDGAAGTEETGRGRAPSYWYNLSLPLLKPGMTDNAVEAVQGLLMAYGYFDGLYHTGRMDAATVNAVKDFQTAQGLDADGEVGGMTWTALLTGR